MKNPDNPIITLNDLQELLARLRGAEGCPWDRKQTPETLKTYLLEEAYELAEALDRRSVAEIHEELGDLLFILLFITRVFEEQGAFDLNQVLKTNYQKMIRRHPHVFGQAAWKEADEVVQGWQAIKSQENPGKNPFDSLPTALPSLLKAHRLAQRAAGLGFDWPDLPGVLQKMHEELDELEAAVQGGDYPSAQAELGDLLFVLVNVGRWLGSTAENALREANLKFQTRFLRLINSREFQERPTGSLTPADWAELWERTKKEE